MARYEVQLIARERIAEGTLAFRFAKPNGFTFTAGQFIRLTLPNPPETDAEGNRRSFSLASAPHEPALMVAMRMRDTAFKRMLGALPLGNAVQLDGPFGVFTLHADTARPAVFLIGGIGITPVRSIAVHAAHAKLPHELWLFYGNRQPEDAAFLTELQALEQRHPHFHLIGTMTDQTASARSWEGETGYVDEPMLRRHLPDLATPIFYLAGPPAMVAAMRALLTSLRVDGSRIRTEEFSGYKTAPR